MKRLVLTGPLIVTSLVLLFTCWCFYPFSLAAATPPVPEHPTNYVVDLAGIIDQKTEANLNRRLKELEKKTTAQMVVLIIESSEGEPIEQFSLRTVERWKLGQKEKDNGILITVAVKDREYRFEVGYGLEAVLPDSLVGSIGREHFVSNFRKGKFSDGIFQAVEVIVNKITAEKEDTSQHLPSVIIPFILILLSGSFLYVFIKYIEPKVKLQTYYTRQELTCHNGFYGGGGFGGGGFSGGGGGFGGGGASGGW